MMLADTIFTEVPVQVAGWLGCAFIVMLLVNEGFKLWKNINPPAHPPNSELSIAGRNLEEKFFGLQQEFREAREARNGEIETIRLAQAADRAAVETERKRSSSSLYRHMDETKAQLENKMEDMRKELSTNLENVRAELSENQRLLPNEIVTLLKNTNAI